MNPVLTSPDARRSFIKCPRRNDLCRVFMSPAGGSSSSARCPTEAGTECEQSQSQKHFTIHFTNWGAEENYSAQSAASNMTYFSTSIYLVIQIFRFYRESFPGVQVTENFTACSAFHCFTALYYSLRLHQSCFPWFWPHDVLIKLDIY